MATKIKLGISSCLLGQKVRFNGGHKHDNYINNTLCHYFDFEPICPEVAIGLGTPREPIHLVANPNGLPRLKNINDHRMDHTDALEKLAVDVQPTLKTISGYILKNRSPTCGMERVKVYNAEGQVLKEKASGVYARSVLRMLPALPIEEEGRLGDAEIRENFIERIFVYHRWQQLLASKISVKNLIDFHTVHTYQIIAHNLEGYQQLERLIAVAGELELTQLANAYILELMETFKHKATRKSHSKILQNIMDCLQQHIDSDDKAELNQVINRYRSGEVPLIVPITLLNHHFRRYPNPYIQQQYYMNPNPNELMLRNNL
ncbi:MAG: DUF523 and DUF1722 domain-containing protein [Methylococcaceae bacterium]